MTHRSPITQNVRNVVHARQSGRCALCVEEYPLHVHHIRPVADGGSNEPDNLVLLCANHHALADLAILPPSLLRRYRDASGERPELPGNAISLYELRATLLAQCLFEGLDAKAYASAANLVSRLRRLRGERFRKICLELLDAMLASLALHDPHGVSAEAVRLRKQFDLVRDDMSDHESLFMAARVEHHSGLLLHAEGQYEDALDRYASARTALSGLEPRDDVVGELRTIAVHESSAHHLDGDSDRGREIADRVLVEDASDYAGGFAAIKLAEHRAVREETEEALGQLTKALQTPEANRPLLRVMVLKGLATLHDREGSKAETLACATAALLLCQQYGLRYQANQLLERLGAEGKEAAELARYEDADCFPGRLRQTDQGG